MSAHGKRPRLVFKNYYRLFDTDKKREKKEPETRSTPAPIWQLRVRTAYTYARKVITLSRFAPRYSRARVERVTRLYYTCISRHRPIPICSFRPKKPPTPVPKPASCIFYNTQIQTSSHPSAYDCFSSITNSSRYDTNLWNRILRYEKLYTWKSRYQRVEPRLHKARAN